MTRPQPTDSSTITY